MRLSERGQDEKAITATAPSPSVGSHCVSQRCHSDTILVPNAVITRYHVLLILRALPFPHLSEYNQSISDSRGDSEQVWFVTPLTLLRSHTRWGPPSYPFSNSITQCQRLQDSNRNTLHHSRTWLRQSGPLLKLMAQWCLLTNYMHTCTSLCSPKFL